MHMRGQHEGRLAVTIKHHEKYQFMLEASEGGRAHGNPYLSDDPDPVGGAAGPSLLPWRPRSGALPVWPCCSNV
jgi:hypothetical protein